MPATLLVETMTGEPHVMWQALLLIAVVAGVVLWLLGRRMARSAYAVCGLVLGGIGSLAVSQEVNGDGTAIPWVIIGAVVGCLLSFLMFRIWMSLSFAVLLSLLAPAANIVWGGDYSTG